MPEWLSITLAVVMPLGAFAGVFFSRGRTEQRMVGRIDLLGAKLDATIAAHEVRFKGVEDDQVDAKKSRSRLYEADKERDGQLRDMKTVCKFTHPDRVAP